MNTHIDTDAGRPVDTARPIGPGSQLRQARLDLKLAPEDVAHILHLSTRQIVALEDDDYEKLPGPTYVRGYLRGYAQLLGLSAEPVVDAYNRLVATKKPVDLGKLGPKPEIRSDHQLIKLATVAVIVIVLGLSAVWWQEQERPPPRTQTLGQTPAMEEPVAEESSSTVPADVRPDATLPTVPVPDTARATAPVKPPVPATDPLIAAGPVAATQTPAAAAAPRGRMVVRTEVESWADIRDASGNRLLYEVIPAGRTVSVEGATPLSVFLGNANGVKVEFNNQPVDVARYKRGDIARFTLGADVKTP
jgi:cytoskeleton protein RodZ